ncbi:YggT family protein [Nocardioides sp. T5]|uniref:YggT family protein n=1 Tax=Nocardioides sp. T5 TaxID=3400182 RepID=UPI003A8ACD67
MVIFGSILWYILFIFIGLLWIRFIVDWVQVFAPVGSPRARCSWPSKAYSATDPPIVALRRVVPPLRIGQVALDLSLPAGDGGSMAAAQRGRDHLRPLEPSVTRVTVPGGVPGAIVF